MVAGALVRCGKAVLVQSQVIPQGGDVKFLSAAGAYLGLYELSLVLIPTTVTAVLYGYIKSEKSVPLAFVFCIGYIIKAVIFSVFF